MLLLLDYLLCVGVDDWEREMGPVLMATETFQVPRPVMQIRLGVLEPVPSRPSFIGPPEGYGSSFSPFHQKQFRKHLFLTHRN